MPSSIGRGPIVDVEAVIRLQQRNRLGRVLTESGSGEPGLHAGRALQPPFGGRGMRDRNGVTLQDALNLARERSIREKEAEVNRLMDEGERAKMDAMHEAMQAQRALEAEQNRLLQAEQERATLEAQRIAQQAEVDRIRAQLADNELRTIAAERNLTQATEIVEQVRDGAREAEQSRLLQAERDREAHEAQRIAQQEEIDRLRSQLADNNLRTIAAEQNATQATEMVTQLTQTVVSTTQQLQSTQEEVQRLREDNAQLRSGGQAALDAVRSEQDELRERLNWLDSMMLQFQAPQFQMPQLTDGPVQPRIEQAPAQQSLASSVSVYGSDENLSVSISSLSLESDLDYLSEYSTIGGN